MYKLFLIFVLALGLTAPVYAGNEIVRKVDDFTGLEMVTFKKPLKFEKQKGVAIGSTWLTPEAAINPDGSIAWLRWRFERVDYHSWLQISQAWNSTLKLKLNTNEIIEFRAKNDLSETRITRDRLGGDYTEHALFGLTLDQLKTIVNASEITKGRVSGANSTYVDIPKKWNKIHQDWLLEMRRFYNAVFNTVPTQTEQP